MYPKNPPAVIDPTPAPQTTQESREDVAAPIDVEAEAGILQAIPEAILLQPQVMLTLSSDLFMNRCADFPSPWPHWSELTSELAAKPSMYRTAFNDFHRLVVSVTKRLVQTALMQTTSRLRAQRLRTNKGLQPFVKKRDVYTAIDVLGMKRDGRDRWKGVPRRCGLKVLTSTNTPRGRRKREVPWSEIERIMSSTAAPKDPSSTGAETSAGSEIFKSRAARSGTPLPMQNLTLSDSDDDFGPDGLSDGADEASIEHFNGEEQRHTMRQAFQPRDVAGKFASRPPSAEAEEPLQQLYTLEQFDHEASRQEEIVLWDMLNLEPTLKTECINTDEPHDLDAEKITTIPVEWRKTVNYRPPWEAYSKSISVAKFLTNQKPASPMATTNARRSISTRSPSENVSDGSSTSRSRRATRKSPLAIELRARGTNAYAALQGEDLEDSEQSIDSSSSEAEDEELEQDIPAQSIEAENDVTEVESVSL